MTQSNNVAHPELNRALVWFSIAAIVLSVPLVVNLVGRLQAEAQMRAAVQQMSARVDDNKTKLVQLQEALDYAKSSAYTERWARAQAHWAKPGETVVIDATKPSSAEAPPQLWWEAFVTR
jgi:cell division protein FtsB